MEENKYAAYGDKERYLKYTREAWQRAAQFPASKEMIYPEHVIAQEFDSIHNKSILEFGCGPGADALSYLKRGNVVVLCDIVKSNLVQAKKNIGSLAENAYFEYLEHSHILPFADNEFDIVNMHGVAMHIVEPVPVLKELYRVLKKDGFMYVMLYTEFLYERFKDSVEKLMKERNISRWESFCWLTDGPNSPYARYYTEQEGKEMFESIGFEIISTYVYNNQDFRTFKLKK